LTSLVSTNNVINVLLNVQGGKLFFMEHVYAKGGALRCVQWMIRGLWFTTFDGCQLRRETQLYIGTAGFQHVDLEEFDAVELTQPLSMMVFAVMIRPHISGTATK